MLKSRDWLRQLFNVFGFSTYYPCWTEPGERVRLPWDKVLVANRGVNDGFGAKIWANRKPLPKILSS
jgi:hypothetical protein